MRSYKIETTRVLATVLLSLLAVHVVPAVAQQFYLSIGPDVTLVTCLNFKDKGGNPIWRPILGQCRGLLDVPEAPITIETWVKTNLQQRDEKISALEGVVRTTDDALRIRIDALTARVANWEGDLAPHIVPTIAPLMDQISRLQAQVDTLGSRVAALEAALSKSPPTGGKPKELRSSK